MSDAYIEGFCKTAEDAGVDPLELVKSAYEFVGDNDIYNNNVQNKSYGNSIAERAGTTTSSLFTGGVGAALGAAKRGLGRYRRFGRSAIGAVAGLTTGALANMLAKGTGMTTRQRTRNEQLAHDSVRHNLANLFIPGVAAYNGQKRNERVLTGLWHS